MLEGGRCRPKGVMAPVGEVAVELWHRQLRVDEGAQGRVEVAGIPFMLQATGVAAGTGELSKPFASPMTTSLSRSATPL